MKLLNQERTVVVALKQHDWMTFAVRFTTLLESACYSEQPFPAKKRTSVVYQGFLRKP